MDRNLRRTDAHLPDVPDLREKVLLHLCCDFTAAFLFQWWAEVKTEGGHMKKGSWSEEWGRQQKHLPG